MDSSSFLVAWSTEYNIDSLIPRFRRVREVSRHHNIMKCSCLFHERNGLPCVHIAHVLKKYFNGWDGFSCYDISIFWWTIQLYASSKTLLDEDVKEIQSLIDSIKNKDSQGVYILSSVEYNSRSPTYQYGSQSCELFRCQNAPDLFSKHPQPPSERCLNYSKDDINHCMSEFSCFLFGLSQISHPDSSSDDDNVTVDNFMDSLHFESRQASFEENNLKIFSERESSYFALKDSFNSLCKLIDGDDEMILKWKDILDKGTADATEKLSGIKINDKHDEVGEKCNVSYVSAYKGTSGLKKRKKRKVLKTSEYR